MTRHSWVKGAHIPSMTPWGGGREAGPSTVWGSELPDASRATVIFSDADDPPDIHLSRRRRRRKKIYKPLAITKF